MPQQRYERDALVGSWGKEPPPSVVACTGAARTSSRKLKPGPGRSATEVADHQQARIHSAMVEIVAERGYGAVTVRELARLAGISTRTFYQHYSSKEECFARTHQQIVSQLLRSLVAAQAGVRDPKQRLWLAVDAIVGEWSRDPKAARLMLIEAYKAGPTAVKQAQRASRSIEAGVGGSLDGDLEGAAIPPLIAEGIASGLTSVARSQLLSKRQEPLTGLGDALGSWALSYLSPAATQLEELDRSLRPQGGQVEFSPSAVSSRGAGGDVALQPHGDRLLLLSAVAKLAVVEGQGDLTPGRILAAAGVSRRSFDANFAHVEDCFSAALELYAGEAIARAKQTTGRKGLTPAGAACQAVTSLCVQVAQDSVFASLCFGGIATTVVRTMRSHERFMADIACLAEGGEILVDERAGKASAGALWGVLHNAVTMGRAQRVPQISATLAYLMLAPAFGASATLEAMREEHGLLAA